MHFKRIGEYVTIVFRSYVHELGLCKISFKQKNNDCVKLLYYSSTILKTESLLGYHCDVIYNNHGSYMHTQNYQLENTSNIIITFDIVAYWNGVDKY